MSRVYERSQTEFNKCCYFSEKLDAAPKPSMESPQKKLSQCFNQNKFKNKSKVFGLKLSKNLLPSLDPKNDNIETARKSQFISYTNPQHFHQKREKPNCQTSLKINECHRMVECKTPLQNQQIPMPEYTHRKIMSDHQVYKNNNYYKDKQAEDENLVNFLITGKLTFGQIEETKEQKQTNKNNGKVLPTESTLLYDTKKNSEIGNCNKESDIFPIRILQNCRVDEKSNPPIKEQNKKEKGIKEQNKKEKGAKQDKQHIEKYLSLEDFSCVREVETIQSDSFNMSLLDFCPPFGGEKLLQQIKLEDMEDEIKRILSN